MSDQQEMPQVILTFAKDHPFDDACHPDVQNDEALCQKCCAALESMNKIAHSGRVVAKEYRNHVDHNGTRYTIVMQC